MRTKYKMPLFILIIILVIGGLFLLVNQYSDVLTGVKSTADEHQEQTVSYANGDYIYTPDNEEIGYDSEEEIFFYNNLLNLMLSSEITKKEANELANKVDGNLVGMIQGPINMLQVQVEERSFKELNQLAEQFESSDLVEYANPSVPSFLSDLGNTEENDRVLTIDEANPDGDDWWAEAINAYSAWDGAPPMIKEQWNLESNWFRQLIEDIAYPQYLDAVQNSNDYISAQLILALEKLLASDQNNDFLIVQAAGNGYSHDDWDKRVGAEVLRTGVFANINEDTYNLASEINGKELRYKLDNILSQVIVVGGAQQTDDKSGYKSPKWASYGEAIDIAAPASDLF